MSKLLYNVFVMASKFERNRAFSSEAFENRRRFAEGHGKSSAKFENGEEDADTKESNKRYRKFLNEEDSGWSEKGHVGISSAHVVTNQEGDLKLGVIKKERFSEEPETKGNHLYSEFYGNLIDSNESRIQKTKGPSDLFLEEDAKRNKSKANLKDALALIKSYWVNSGNQGKDKAHKDKLMSAVEKDLNKLRKKEKEKTLKDILGHSEILNIKSDVENLIKKINGKEDEISGINAKIIIEKDKKELFKLNERKSNIKEYIEVLKRKLESKESLLEILDTGISIEELNSFSDEDINFYIMERRKGNKLESLGEKKALLNELGFSRDDIFGLSDKEIYQILNNKINKKDWVYSFDDSEEGNMEKEFSNIPESKKLLSLGFSPNQIIHVLSESDRKEIVEKNLNQEGWLAESRKKYSTKKEAVSAEVSNVDKGEPTIIKDIKEDKSAETLEMPKEKESVISSSENISRRKYLEDNIKILEHELLLISKDLDRAVEGGEKSKVERLNQLFDAKDNELRKFKKALRGLPLETNSPANRIDQSKFAEALRGTEANVASPAESVVNNQESQERGGKLLSLFELGYSPKEVADMDLKKRTEIYKNQIRKVGEESASPSQSETLEGNSDEGDGEGGYNIEYTHSGPGGHERVVLNTDKKGVIGFLKGEKIPNVSGAPSSGGVENVLTQRRIEETEVLEEIISDDIYERFKKENIVPEYILTEIAYLIIERKRELTEREKAIFAGKTSEINKIIEKIKPEEGDNSPISQDAAVFEQNGPGKPGENFSEELGGTADAPSEGVDEKVGDVDLSRRIAMGVLDEESSHEGRQQKIIKPEKSDLTVESFVDHLLENTHSGVVDKSQISNEQLFFYKKNKDLVKAEITRRQQGESKNEESVLENIKEDRVSSVSAGAKEFLKNERASAEKEREEKTLFSILERGYENLDKSQLIEIAKERGIASGADKQVLIEKIIKDDLEKGSESFGFIDQQIKSKLSEYNISEKQMAFISPDFFSLSTEKQRYLISKLEQKIYLDADFSSKDRNEEEIKKMGFWKKLGATFNKGRRQVAMRDQMILDVKTNGASGYESDISTLSKYLIDAPEMSYKPNEKGRLVPYFEYVNTESIDKKFETPKNFLNASASRLGEVPYEWSLPSATSRQKEMYYQAFSSYTGAKETYVKALIEEEVRKNPKITDAEKSDIERKARIEIFGVDAKVKFGTYITQNPEMEKLSAGFIEKVLGAKSDKFVRGAAFFGAGYLTKWLGRSMAVTGVGLGVSAAVGGFMAYRKKNLEYSEKELRQRYGKEVSDLKLKKAVNSSNVFERLEKLNNSLEKAGDEKTREKILATIKTRLFVTEEMMRDGRINFGSQKDQVLNQFKLTEMISKASMTVAMNGGFSNEKTEEEKVFDRFKQWVKDSEIQKMKKDDIRMAALKGAGVAALGFGAGAGVRYLQEQGYFEALWDLVKEGGAEGLEKLKEGASYVGGVTHDYFKEGGDILESASNSAAELAKDSAPIETVMAGSRGFIGAIDDLQDKLKLRFGANMPAQYQEFMSKNPHVLAKEWGVYNPGEVNESAAIIKGEGLSIDSKGVVRFMGLNGTDEMYVPKGVEGVSPVESERRFFDSGNTAKVEANPLAEKNPSLETSSFAENNSSYRGPAQVNEGYVRTRLETPTGEPKSWYEKPVPTEFGASPVRGEYRFLNSPDGKIVGIDTSKMISDEVLKFRKDPAAFLNKDLSGTTLLAKTDSFAVKTLRDNGKLIEEFLAKKNVLDAPAGNLTAEQTTFLKNDVYRLGRDVSLKTNGAFDSGYKPSIIERMGGKPTTYFSTDNQVEPRINPSTVSTEEAPSVAKEPKPADLTESNNAREPLQKSVKVESLNAEQKTYSFNTENIKGKIRFIYNEKGEIVEIQNSQSTSIGGINNAEKMLKDDWMSKAGQYSKDEAVGIKKIKTNIKTLKEYMTILEEGGFKPNSLEYKYLNGRINLLKEEYKDILK